MTAVLRGSYQDKTFENLDFYNALLRNCNFYNCTFQNCNLTDSYFEQSVLNCKFPGTKLTGTWFSRVPDSIEGADLSEIKERFFWLFNWVRDRYGRLKLIEGLALILVKLRLGEFDGESNKGCTEHWFSQVGAEISPRLDPFDPICAWESHIRRGQNVFSDTLIEWIDEELQRSAN